MGGCQNYSPFLGTLNIRGRIIIGTPKRTIILTTTHIYNHIIISIQMLLRGGRTQGLGFRIWGSRFLRLGLWDECKFRV